MRDVALVEYFQEARIRYFWRLHTRGDSWSHHVVARTDVDLLAPVPHRHEPYVVRSRIAHVGGASSLLVEPGGPTLWDVTVDQLPAEVKPEIQTGMHILDDLRATPESVDWFFVSPPERFGAWAPVPSNGRYRLGGDVLLRDEDGESTISAADLAVAIVDEIERPAHHRGRFTAIREG